jgi:hypothetical protein
MQMTDDDLAAAQLPLQASKMSGPGLQPNRPLLIDIILAVLEVVDEAYAIEFGCDGSRYKFGNFDPHRA